MADLPSTFEIEDLLGSTIHQNGTVGTTAVSIPTSNTKVIQDVNIECMEENKKEDKLFVSFDGGTNFRTLKPGDSLMWTIKGDATQIHIKATGPGVQYESMFNVED